VWCKGVVPRVEFFRQRRELLQGKIVRRASRIDLFQDPRENSSSAEECECTRYPCVLTRARCLEASLLDVLLVSVTRFLAVDILILELFR
jgi:hypothetical protein